MPCKQAAAVESDVHEKAKTVQQLLHEVEDKKVRTWSAAFELSANAPRDLIQGPIIHSDCDTCPAHSLACQRQHGRHPDGAISPGLPACSEFCGKREARFALPRVGVRTRVRFQKEAGILERGMAALRSGIASLLGLSSQPKPEDKVRHSAVSPA